MKNILFIAPTNYTLPINETLKKKFFALSEVCNVRVLAFADISTTTNEEYGKFFFCLLYTSPSPRDRTRSRMPSSA